MFCSCGRSNGDDTVGLVRTDPSSGRQTLVDIIGGLGDDPGDGWAVAGIEVSALPCGCSVSASLITLCCVESCLRV